LGFDVSLVVLKNYFMEATKTISPVSALIQEQKRFAVITKSTAYSHVRGVAEPTYHMVAVYRFLGIPVYKTSQFYVE
jgi:hypothetical protein